MDFDESMLPMQYKPLSPWAYFGYTILFSIPVVGLILLIVFSFSNDNINKRNFARSYFCVYALALILCLIFGGLLGAAGVASYLGY
ncbi:MAG: hypothetical protein ACI4JJ_03675 [Huintestinicola sp.]